MYSVRCPLVSFQLQFNKHYLKVKSNAKLFGHDFRCFVNTVYLHTEKGCCAPESGIVFFPLSKNYAPIIFIQIVDKMAFRLYRLEFPV
jgi:hypothetical protein